MGFGNGQFEACGVEPARIIPILHSDNGISAISTVSAGQSRVDGFLRRRIRLALSQAGLPLLKKLGIDPIFGDDVIYFFVEPGFKRRAALGRGLPRLGEPLRKTECDERIMGAPAQKLASPEAEPRQAGRLLPFTQRWRGRRIGRAVRPCLSYDGADRDAQPIFEIVRNEALPGTKIIRLGGPCTRLNHPQPRTSFHWSRMA